jgi:NodT family efflux transporter outer membrane factor (OMF) lipoprotein
MSWVSKHFKAGTSGRGLAMVTALLLAGCATVPDLGAAPEMKNAEAYKASETFRGPSIAWPADGWWTAYGDAQLSQLVEEGLAGAPDLRQAEARLNQAQAAAQTSGAKLSPQVNAKGSFTEFNLSSGDGAPAFIPDGWSNVAQSSLDFSFEFDFWGKNRAALASAKSSAEAARAEVQQARLVLSTSIASAYAGLAQLYADHDAAEDALRVRTATAELIAGRHAQGLENEVAFKRAEAGRAEAEADLAANAESIALQKNKIAALLGDGPDRGLAVQRPANPLLKSFGLPENLQADLLGRRPDIAAARSRVEGASEQTKSAKAQFYPNVNLTAMLGANSLGLAGLERAGLGYAAIAPAISLPIFDGGKLEGNYRNARGQYDEAVAAYDGALTAALKEVADVAASKRALQPRLDASRAALLASAEAHSLVESRYRGGLSTYLDVLSAEDSLIANRRAVADLETRAFTLDVALVRALGGGFHS